MSTFFISTFVFVVAYTEPQVVVQQQQVDISAGLCGGIEVPAKVCWCWCNCLVLRSYAIHGSFDVAHNRLMELPAVLAQLSQLVK